MLAERYGFAERVCQQMLVAALALTATALVTQAVAETIIIQGSTTFSRRLMEPYKSAIEVQFQA